MKQEKWDKFLKLVSDETSTWIEDLEHYNQNKEELDTNFEIELNDLITAQETLEEAAANLADPNICKTDNWIAGAKWQQERMYSEEEVTQLLIKFNQEIQEVEDVREWFEQNKKQ